MDAVLVWLAISRPEPLIEWAWSRRDVVSVNSWDISVQSILTGLYEINPFFAEHGMSEENPRALEHEDADRLRAMVGARSPTYRLLALSVADRFEKDPESLIAICERASKETNQIFWKTALTKLTAVGGPDVIKAAAKFELHKPVPSDGGGAL